MNIYNALTRLLPFLWFSMRLGVINSFLIVCFTMVQKIFKSENIYKIRAKYHVMARKQHLGKMYYIYHKYKRKFNQLFFPQFQLTKHFVDQVSADYNGYYIQGSGKSDKYGFFWCLPEKLPMRLDVFLNSSTKFKILS